MDVLTGILVDVSGSMEVNVDDRKVGETGSSWAKSIFKFIDRLVEHDASTDQRVFAVGVGSSCSQVTFDVLTTLKRLEMDKAYRSKRDMLKEMMRIIETNGAPRISDFLTVDEMDKRIDEHQTAALLTTMKYSSEFVDKFIALLPASCRSTEAIGLYVQDALRYPRITVNASDVSKRDKIKIAMYIMETNGAPRIHTWTTVQEIDEQIDDKTTNLVCDALENDRKFRSKFIFDVLPPSCRVIESLVAEGVNSVGGCRRQRKDKVEDVISKGVNIIMNDIIDRAMKLVKDYILSEVTGEAVYCAKDASEILRGCVGEQELTEHRTNKLYEDVKPYIFGGTPLIKSIDQALRLFRDNSNSQYKLLFILSDGQPADGDNPPMTELADLGVKVVCCYITSEPIDEPRRLYSNKNWEWERPAQCMFDMSSTIPTQKIPRTLFVKKGWKIDIDRNETRLFFQINHPDIIDEVCKLGRDCVCCQDSLADVLSTVSLDIYINKANEGLSPDQQKDKEKTCYAIASATVIHMALMRIVGREGGYPDFYKIRDELITTHGVNGAVVGKVLREVCPKYRLQCKKTDERGALNAVVEKRPVVAIFQLSDAEWRLFHKFYQDNPRGMLTKCDVNIEHRPLGVKLRGHAVVLTSFNSEGLRLMNSRGTEFANNGFFRVRNAAVLGMEFFDVFWTEEDLLPAEKEAYRRDGPIIAAKLMKSLTSLQTATYTCPLCFLESNLSEFRGHLLAAVCPRCRGTFNANEDHSDLALNIYLTSLLSPDSQAEKNRSTN